MWNFLKPAATYLNPYMASIKLVFWGLIVLTIMGLWLYGDHYHTKYIDERVAFELFEGQIKDAAERRIKDDQRKEREAAKVEEVMQALHDDEVNKLKLDTTKLKKELTDAKSYIANVINAANRLRDAPTGAGGTGVSGLLEPAGLPTESWRDCNTTLIRTVRACQDTTIKYNSLYNDWVAKCKIHGCK
jgi:hypothetical protein